MGMRYGVGYIGEQDLHLLGEGTHRHLYSKLGSHVIDVGGEPGVVFAVWAPNAASVSVAGDFNGWNRTSHHLHQIASSGVWEGFVPGLGKGTVYKYHVQSGASDYRADKSDPYAIHAEVAPDTASIVWDLDYEWDDSGWMGSRSGKNALAAPVSIYEAHLGSWRRLPDQGNRSLGFREVAEPFADHVRAHGFTHVELMPVMEHPFFGSWGYQVTGYYAPSSRFGTPQDLMYLVDVLHQRGIGVILDWVPSHFPTDEHGLAYFDGTHLYEHADPRQGYHPDWHSYVFNYGRHEVSAFLLSNALYWLEVFHADGLRVDAVASMLHLDFSRSDGGWIANEHGGRENLDALAFLRLLNEVVHAEHPDVLMVAEESTTWPLVTRPVYVGGLGFDLKWDMGWMHDTLDYMSLDPVYRKYDHTKLTFRQMYAHSENFALALSHDEVVHLKGSLLGKMPGVGKDEFSNLRLLYGYMYGQTGKKLLFMGAELAQRGEWSHDGQLDWWALDHESHRGVERFLADLNKLYREEPALHELDCEPYGFYWIDCHDSDKSLLSFMRQGRTTQDLILVACNFTPVPRHDYRLGVPRGGRWAEVLNSDAVEYWGQGHGNLGGVEAMRFPAHGQQHSIVVTLPPLSAVFFKSAGPPPEAPEPEPDPAGAAVENGEQPQVS